MLTGRAKGGLDCNCGQADCWQGTWETMAEPKRARMIRLHDDLVAKNKRVAGADMLPTRREPAVEPHPAPARAARPSRTPSRSTGRKKPLVDGDPITPQGTLFCLKCRTDHPHEDFRQGVGYRYKSAGDLTYQKWCGACLRKHSRRR